MATYRISGVWKNTQGVLTHYAFHTVSDNSVSRAVRKTKEQAIAIVEARGNTVTIWLWDYSTSRWKVGEPVHVVNGFNGKFLRTNHDNQVVDNLDHLIDFDWLSS